jgi:recombination protein RecA
MTTKRKAIEDDAPTTEAALPSGPRVPRFALPERDDIMKAALSAVRRKFGEEAIFRMQEDHIRPHDVLPTGSLLLDRALGGGWPFGRLVELYGPPGGGKTTMSLEAVSRVQGIGGTAGFIDAEHAFDPMYAGQIGVHVPDLLISQPDYGEQGLDILMDLVQAGINLIIVDSVAALTPKAELEGDLSESDRPGVHAKMMTRALKRIAPIVSKAEKCLVILINQIRMAINSYGNPETTTGGKALMHYASVRLEVRPGEKLKRGDDIYGQRVKLKAAKNKVAPPFRAAEADLIFGRGLWRAGEVLDLAFREPTTVVPELGEITKSGAYYAIGGERIAQGRENAATYLEQHPDVLQRLEDHVRLHLFR